jgi:hypothetical protein
MAGTWGRGAAYRGPMARAYRGTWVRMKARWEKPKNPRRANGSRPPPFKKKSFPPQARLRESATEPPHSNYLAKFFTFGKLQLKKN